MTYNVFGGTLSLTQSINHCIVNDTLAFPLLHNALLQLLHSSHLLPVDSLLETVSLQTADILNIFCEFRTTSAASAEFYYKLMFRI